MMQQDVDIVLGLIKQHGCSTLGCWDGCCCSQFSLRAINVDIACGKGGKQGVWVSSVHSDYEDEDPILRPIMEEVVRQCDEFACRGSFVGHLRPWNKDKDR